MSSTTDSASELAELLRSRAQNQEEILRCLERYEQRAAEARDRLAPWAQTIDRIKKEEAQRTQRIVKPVKYASRPRGSGYSKWTTPAMERESEGRKQKAAQRELEAERKRAADLLKRLTKVEQRQQAERRAEEARTRKAEARKANASSSSPSASKWLWWRSSSTRSGEDLPPAYSVIDSSQNRETEKLEK